MAGFLDGELYPDPAFNQDMKQVHRVYLLTLSDVFEKSGGKAIRSLSFDAKKFTKDAAIQWAKDRGLDTSDVASSDKETVIGLRPYSDFEISDLTETVNLAEGISAFVKKLTPLAVENRTLAIQHQKVLRQDGSQWVVYSRDGSKKLGTHEKKEDALAQVRAVEVNKMAQELESAHIKMSEVVTSLQGVQLAAAQFTIEVLKRALKEYPQAASEVEVYKGGSLKVTKDANGDAQFDLNVTFAKVDDEKRELLGIVYAPDVIDAQGDSASAEEIEKAQRKFNAGAKTLGIMHKERSGERAYIVESYLAPTDFRLNGRLVKRGTWLMSVRVTDDELWSKVKSGKITGFSMAGRAKAGA